ncbi:hypothetical protein AcetOrient_orf04270 [Acetobacter orientalis]|uniref:Uncharacterized protein n=1 Tax=Acetobacter orientalis TaxID=146474 RepID=A0A2Z5ZKX5_9PROT|nr:hypothetical protein AcetOrient_orf04270 [Acetobacter orientalis]
MDKMIFIIATFVLFSVQRKDGALRLFGRAILFLPECML